MGVLFGSISPQSTNGSRRVKTLLVHSATDCALKGILLQGHEQYSIGQLNSVIGSCHSAEACSFKWGAVVGHTVLSPMVILFDDDMTIVFDGVRVNCHICWWWYVSSSSLDSGLLHESPEVQCRPAIILAASHVQLS